MSDKIRPSKPGEPRARDVDVLVHGRAVADTMVRAHERARREWERMERALDNEDADFPWKGAGTTHE